MQRQSGFSAVELAITLAIAGILASIAIPNFINYVNKSKQNEAKVNLEALYSAEKIFYFNQNYYSPRLDAIGFRPVGSLIYRIGFGADSGGSPPVGTATCVATNSAACPASAAPWTESPTATAAGAIGAANIVSSPVPTSFRAEARALLNGTASDVWNVDENSGKPTSANQNGL